MVNIPRVLLGELFWFFMSMPPYCLNVLVNALCDLRAAVLPIPIEILDSILIGPKRRKAELLVAIVHSGP